MQLKITLQSLGKEKLNEVENLPVLYNQELADLIEKCQQPVDMFIDEPIEEQLENYQQIPQEDVRSGIIEGLYYALRFSTDDYMTVKRPQYNGKFAHDNMVRNDIEDYYNNRVQQQAEEIIQFIDGLVQRDGWNPYKFGNYKMIKVAIDKHQREQKALYLNMLRVCALTAIPMDIKFEETQIIEPTITSPQRTV